MLIERDGRRLDVLDDPSTDSWGFWTEFAAGEWEPFTLAMIERLLDEQRDGVDYLDIGAWIGPTVLWAAPHARRTRAVEPDPVAAGTLRANVDRNLAERDVSIIEAAAWTHRRGAALGSAHAFGDSMSSITRSSDRTIDVASVPLEDLVDDLEPALVKIDIEGGEGVLVPHYADLLHELHCPVLLGLHWPWVGGHGEALDQALASWHVELIDSAGRSGFETVLLWT